MLILLTTIDHLIMAKTFQNELTMDTVCSDSSRSTQRWQALGITRLVYIFWRCFGVGFCSTAGCEALRKIVFDVFNMLDANRDANHILGDPRVQLFLFA